MIVAPSAVGGDRQLGARACGPTSRSAARTRRRIVRIAARFASPARPDSGDAVEQRELGEPGRADRVDRRGDLDHRRHPGRDDHRAATCGQALEERQVRQLARAHLETPARPSHRGGRRRRRRTASRGTRCRDRWRAAGARPRHPSAGPAARASPADPPPGRWHAGTRRWARRPRRGHRARRSGT